MKLYLANLIPFLLFYFSLRWIGGSFRILVGRMRRADHHWQEALLRCLGLLALAVFSLLSIYFTTDFFLKAFSPKVSTLGAVGAQGGLFVFIHFGYEFFRNLRKMMKAKEVWWFSIIFNLLAMALCVWYMWSRATSFSCAMGG